MITVSYVVSFLPFLCLFSFTIRFILYITNDFNRRNYILIFATKKPHLSNKNFGLYFSLTLEPVSGWGKAPLRRLQLGRPHYSWGPWEQPQAVLSIFVEVFMFGVITKVRKRSINGVRLTQKESRQFKTAERTMHYNTWNHRIWEGWKSAPPLFRRYPTPRGGPGLWPTRDHAGALWRQLTLGARGQESGRYCRSWRQEACLSTEASTVHVSEQHQWGTWLWIIKELKNSLISWGVLIEKREKVWKSLYYFFLLKMYYWFITW